MPIRKKLTVAKKYGLSPSTVSTIYKNLVEDKESIIYVQIINR